MISLGGPRSKYVLFRTKPPILNFEPNYCIARSCISHIVIAAKDTQ